jgi:hypothetical protein
MKPFEGIIAQLESNQTDTVTACTSTMEGEQTAKDVLYVSRLVYIKTQL